MRLAFALPLIALALLFMAPATAAPPPAQSNSRIEAEPPDASAREDVGRIMELTLPLLDGQVLRYYDGDGNFIGLARRRGLTIRFFDAEGNYLGRARRVTQRLTRYFDAEDNYIGRRIDQHLVTTHAATAYRHDPGWDEGTDAGQ
ncbi:MAG TPA: hypothetical protein VFA50_15385 [Stellaceae bacterium]|nr:hypothetical protein [Stellaceae bacterium]